jgi:hypothetical protein
MSASSSGALEVKTSPTLSGSFSSFPFISDTFFRCSCRGPCQSGGFRWRRTGCAPVCRDCLPSKQLRTVAAGQAVSGPGRESGRVFPPVHPRKLFDNKASTLRCSCAPRRCPGRSCRSFHQLSTDHLSGPTSFTDDHRLVSLLFIITVSQVLIACMRVSHWRILRTATSTSNRATNSRTRSGGPLSTRRTRLLTTPKLALIR